jgi:hypothetical protein
MMSGEYCSSCGSQRKKSEPPQGTTDSEAAKALAQKKKELLIKLINNK